MPSAIKAILWDCDGCLIDSEYIACDLAARMLTEAGYQITTESFIRRFCGQGSQHTYDTIQKETGIDFRHTLEKNNKKALQKEVFDKHLTAIKDVVKVLNNLSFLPMAIASGSEYDRLKYTLEITGLYSRFEGRIFSSSLVKKGKPEPDIFLYAAQQLGVQKNHCLVIEDSLNGVKAGKAAGMTTWGFTGGSHIVDKKSHGQELLSLGADHVFDSMLDLLAFVTPQIYPQMQP